MIRVTCPTCGKTMSAPDTKAGKTGKCPCGERIRMPSQVTSNKPDQTPVPADETNRRSPTISLKSGKLLWIILPICGLACIAIGAVVVLLLMKGNKEEQKTIAVIGKDKSDKVLLEEPATPAVDPDQKKILECLEGWLTAQKKGEEGVQYWDDFNRLTSLYAVRSWDILLDEKPKPITVFESEGRQCSLVKVRIDSSTKGGMQISKIWTLSMRKSDMKWKIGSMYGQNPGDD